MVHLNQFLLKLAVGILAVINGGTGTSTPPTAGQVLIGKTDGTYTPADLTAGSNVTITKGNGSVTIASSGGGAGAPSGASYITQVSEAGLSGEQNLAALATGLLKSTTGTGVVSIGVAGTDFQGPDADLDALAALGTTGLVSRTGAATYSPRTIQAGSTKISIANGGGIAGDPSIDAVEANFTLSNIGGSVTDAQVPNTITLDNLTQITTRDHGSLTGLSDDDHSIYALLAGRAGGQTLNGGTAAGDDLSLRSTTNATKGNIFFGAAGTSTFDEVNNRWGFFTASPGAPVDIASSGVVDPVLRLRGPNATDALAVSVENNAGSASGRFFIAGSAGHFINQTSAGDTGIASTGKQLFGQWAGNDTLAIDVVNQRVGIANSSPVYPLTFASTTGDKISLYPAGGTNEYGFAIDSFKLRYVSSASGAGGMHEFHTNSTGRLRIADGGTAIAGNGTLAAPTVSAEVQGTDAVLISKGTTAQRPTGVNGYIRQNTDINSPEFYTEAWTQFVGVLDRAVTQNDVVNTAAETSFYSFSVPANVLDTQKMLRLTLYGDYLNNSGAGRTLTIRVKFGGNTYYNDVSGTLAASASRHPFRWEVLLGNRNATNVQSIGGYFSMGIAGGATTGLGDLATFATNTTGFETPFYNDGAVDTTAARTLEVTVQHSTNNASLSIRRQMAILEVL